MNKLPLELFDEIVSHMDPTLVEGRQSLSNCSVVKKSWARPCQRRLFESVRISSERLQSWQDCVLQKEDPLLSRVRELSCDGKNFFEEQQFRPTHISLCDLFRLFTRLEHFQLGGCDISLLPHKLGLFTAFRETLSCITLFRCQVSEKTLLAFINYFPNLEWLRVQGITRLNRSTPPPHPHFSRRLRKLSIDLVSGVCQTDIIEGFSFEEVAVGSGPNSIWAGFADEVVRAFGPGATRLRLSKIFGDLLTLSPCIELRELEFVSSEKSHPLSDWDLYIISTITSTKIEKIRINHSSDTWNLLVWDFSWTRLDGILVGLVERLGHEKGLEVEFWGDWAFERLYNHRTNVYLPMFVEVGRMKVWNRQNELVYCSDKFLE